MDQTELWKEVFQWVMGLASIVTTAVAAWVVNKFRMNLAMLTRHDESIRQYDEDVGTLLAMKRELEGGQKPLRMIAELDNEIQQLTGEIKELREESRHTEQVQERIREDIGKINVSLSEINTHLLYLRKERPHQ